LVYGNKPLKMEAKSKKVGKVFSKKFKRFEAFESASCLYREERRLKRLLRGMDGLLERLPVFTRIKSDRLC